MYTDRIAMGRASPCTTSYIEHDVFVCNLYTSWMNRKHFIDCWRRWTRNPTVVLKAFLFMEERLRSEWNRLVRYGTYSRLIWNGRPSFNGFWIENICCASLRKYGWIEECSLRNRLPSRVNVDSEPCRLKLLGLGIYFGSRSHALHIRSAISNVKTRWGSEMFDIFTSLCVCVSTTIHTLHRNGMNAFTLLTTARKEETHIDDELFIDEIR